MKLKLGSTRLNILLVSLCFVSGVIFFSFAHSADSDFFCEVTKSNEEFLKDLKKFNAKLRANPNDVGALIDRAWTYGRLEEYRRDIADCTRAIKLDPTLAVAYGERAFARLRLGDYGEALLDVDNAIKKDPNNAAFYCRKASIYNYVGYHEAAIEECNRAIKIDPNYSVAYFHRAWSFNELGMRDAAIVDYSKSISLKKRDISSIYQRGLIYWRMNDIKRASQDLLAASKLDPEDAKIASTLALLHAREGLVYEDPVEAGK